MNPNTHIGRSQYQIQELTKIVNLLILDCTDSRSVKAAKALLKEIKEYNPAA